MQIVVGTLRVNLETNTATFTPGLDKADSLAKHTAKNIEGHFNNMDLREGKGAIMLIGEEIGIRLPRHVNTFLASLPGVAPALAAALPIAVVVMIGMKFVEAAEKVLHFNTEIRKMSHEFDDAALSLKKHGDALDADNLRLEDQVAKLEGRPVKNKPLEAMEAARKKADELADAFDRALRKMEHLLEAEGVSFVKSIFTGQAGTNDIRDAVTPVMQAIEDARSAELRANAEGKADAERAAREKKEAAIKSFGEIITAQEKAVATQKHIETDAARAQHVNEGRAAGAPDIMILERQHDSENAINESYRTKANILTDLAILYAHYQGDLLKVKKFEEEGGKVARLENAASAYAELEKSEKNSLQLRLDGIKEDEARSDLAFERKQIGAAQWAKADVKFAHDAMQAHLEYFDTLEAKAFGSKKDEIQFERAKYLYDTGLAYTKALTAEEAKNNTAIDRMHEALFRSDQERHKKEEEMAISAIAHRNKETLNFIGSGTASASMERYRNAVLSGADALREYNIQLHLTEYLRKNLDATPLQRAVVESELRKQAALQQQIAAAEHAASFQKHQDLQREIQILKELRAAEAAKGRDVMAFDAAIHQAQQQRAQDLVNELLATGRVRDGVRAYLIEYSQQAQITGKKIEQYLIQTTNQFTSTLSRALVEGGVDWRQFAATAIESLVDMGLQAIISATLIKALKALLHVHDDDGTEALRKHQQINFQTAMSDAAAAAANTFAMYTATSGLPVAAAMASVAYGIGAAFAGMAFFEKGGVVPNTGIAMVHEGEGIFSPAITNALLHAAKNQGGDRGGSGRNVTLHYSPQFKVWDKTDVADALDEHADVLQMKMQRAFARMA